MTKPNPKSEYRNPKSETIMKFENKSQNNTKQKMDSKNQKTYDLEERTFEFAKNCRQLVKLIPKTISNIEDGKQLARSSGSVPANYIEANECLGKKDFLMKVKICRKESKESKLWLRLLYIDNHALSKKRNELVQESDELMKIFGSIVRKSE
ncbi:MAG: hypothetical protein Athens101428_593 [Candidatus Berkelbacteria bacterium Athens1014_28]|uniref:S23 ribosomal protein n=1 Tax=Candidatus Berkelbacteria bacterium Athens1014_28 TaxID=2017145 RepID=A0A554LLB7_9BACT|nr:MAG: hypothetical protein Athens101428_593 [Candidatus Berkelbacteria bacterium Athens1014_28]